MDGRAMIIVSATAKSFHHELITDQDLIGKLPPRENTDFRAALHRNYLFALLSVLP